MKRMEGIHNGCINFWNNITEEEYDKWDEKRIKGMIDYYNTLKENNGMNNNEIDLSKILDKYDFIYDIHYFNKIEHPDFKKVFPNNTVTNSVSVSPFHEWDFIIHTLSGNILVDIDGSVHDPKNKTTGITEFNDSKRPYQTDGLPAYAVLCYNDNLTNDTPVKNIITNEIITFKEFIAILQFMDLSKSEQKELLKDQTNKH